MKAAHLLVTYRQSSDAFGETPKAADEDVRAPHPVCIVKLISVTRCVGSKPVKSATVAIKPPFRLRLIIDVPIGTHDFWIEQIGNQHRCDMRIR